AVTVWSSAGTIQWFSGSPATNVAAAGFFAGHLLYVEAHHSRSPGSMVPAAAALLSPRSVVIWPHYHGMDQWRVGLTLSLVAAHRGGARIRRGAAGDPQRRAGPRQGGGRQAGAGGDRFRPGRGGAGRLPGVLGGGGGEGAVVPAGVLSRGGGALSGRSDEASA